MYLEINRIVKNTSVEGFGKRYCIWVQGCSIKCKGCANISAIEKGKGKKIKITEIVADILETKDIEGITFLGGEPFEQAKSLSLIAEEIKRNQLSVITFTGYRYEYLKKCDNLYFNKLLKFTDLLIDGEFDISQFDVSRPWTGSSNQNYIFITDRYNKSQLNDVKNRFEIQIDIDGNIFINGMGDYKKFEKILKTGEIL
jgi:anaerobic ribonucleoside-triphosphate reductase-activating protein